MKKGIINCLIILLSILSVGCGSEEIPLQVYQSDTETLSKEESDASEELEEINSDKENTEENTVEDITVFICGAIKSPGVYTLPSKSRICDGIEIAGGFTDSANTSYLNQASILMEGEKLYIPTKEEVDKGAWSMVTGESDERLEGKVNINQATKEQLMTLTGIGEAKALAIVNYRQDKGEFKSIKDICNVSGIGDAVYNSIKDFIVV